MLKKASFVSVVIVNYNGLGHLRKCLPSLLTSDYPFYEVIIVDNGSKDGSVSTIKKEIGGHQNRITLLNLPNNLGFAMGNRVGADKALGDYLLFLNNDTKVEQSSLSRLVEVMDKDPSIGVAQAKLLLLNEPDTFDSAGVIMSVFGDAFARGENEKDVGQYEQMTEISYAKGAAMIVRRDLWNRLGAFDPLFFTYFEESDFCWRVWLSGYRVVFAPSATVYHVGGATTAKFKRHFLMFQFYRNQVVTVVKNLSLKNLIKYSPGRVGQHLVKVLVHISRNEPMSLLGNMHGVAWCLFFFNKIWVKRLNVQASRVVDDEDLFARGVISRKLLSFRNSRA
jgi:GT2 family glycosyltransferase